MKGEVGMSVVNEKLQDLDHKPEDDNKVIGILAGNQESRSRDEMPGGWRRR